MDLVCLVQNSVSRTQNSTWLRVYADVRVTEGMSQRKSINNVSLSRALVAHASRGRGRWIVVSSGTAWSTE